MNQELQTTWEEDIEAAKSEVVSSVFHAIAAGKNLKEAKEKHRAIYGGTGWRDAIESRGLSVGLVDQYINGYLVWGQDHNMLERSSILSVSSMLKLSGPKVSQEAREAVIEHAQENGKITVAETQAIIEQYKQEGRREQIEKDKAVIERAKARIAHLEGREADLNGELQDKDDIITDLQQKENTRPLSPREQVRLDAAEKANGKYRIELEQIKRQLASEREKQQIYGSDRINREWVNTAHNLVSGNRVFLARCPDSIAAQSLDADGWQLLEEAEVSVKRVLQAIFDVKQGVTVDSSNGNGKSMLSVVESRIVDAG